MDDAHASQGNGGGGLSGLHALASGLGQDNLHARVVHVVIDGAGCIASTAHAGNEVVGMVAAFLLL